MTQSTVAVTRAELEDGHWSKGTLTVRFAPDAFDAAGAFYEIAETNKIFWSSLASYTDRLLHAYVEQSWPESDNRTFFVRHWLGESPEALDRFMTEVLPYLEVSFVGEEVNRGDSRLTS